MKKILIADDSPTIRKVFQVVMKKRNEYVEFTEDGEEAIEKIKEFIPDVLFLDANMPKKDGWEVLEYVKNNYPEIYVILMTAEDEIKSIASPNEIMKKPFQIGDIKEILDKVL